MEEEKEEELRAPSPELAEDAGGEELPEDVEEEVAAGALGQEEEEEEGAAGWLGLAEPAAGGCQRGAPGRVLPAAGE